MAKGICSVCSLSPDDRDYGEKLIVEGKQYREVVELSPNGPSKSSWHRHMKTCYRRRKFYGVGKQQADAEARVIAMWADGTLTVQGEMTPKHAPVEIQRSELRSTDIVLAITYAEIVIRTPVALAEQAIAEDEERFPPVTVATEESDAAPVEVEQVAQVETTPTPPTPCTHVMVRVSGDISRCVNCGHQDQPPVIVGVSRKSFEERKSPLRSFGRFG